MSERQRKFYARGSEVIHRPSGSTAEFGSPAQARRAAREANARDEDELGSDAPMDGSRDV